MERERQMVVYSITVPESLAVPHADVNHCFPEVSVRGPLRRSPTDDLPRLLTPTSDYGSDAPLLRGNGMSQTSTISSLKVPRFEISEACGTGPPCELNDQLGLASAGRQEDESEVPLGTLLRPESEPLAEGRSLLSQPTGDLTPRILRLKAKAPMVTINDANGEIEKLNLFEDAMSTSASMCRSYRSLNSCRSGPDRKTSVGLPANLLLPGDPFWHLRSRDVEPPKHPRLKKAGHYCRKVMTFMCSHVGLFVIVASYTALGALIFPSLENERALMIRKELHEQTHNLSVKLLDEVWQIGTFPFLANLRRFSVT